MTLKVPSKSSWKRLPGISGLEQDVAADVEDRLAGGRPRDLRRRVERDAARELDEERRCRLAHQERLVERGRIVPGLSFQAPAAMCSVTESGVVHLDRDGERARVREAEPVGAATRETAVIVIPLMRRRSVVIAEIGRVVRRRFDVDRIAGRRSSGVGAELELEVTEIVEVGDADRAAAAGFDESAVGISMVKVSISPTLRLAPYRRSSRPGTAPDATPAMSVPVNV